jgi:hypothetical protein
MEITANTVQTVGQNQNILFTDEPITSCRNGSILHREGSGLVTLKGNTQQCRARYRVTFGGNAALLTTGTSPISFAIAINGEPVASTTMTITPTAVASYFNISSSVIIDVPRGCCSSISVKNISSQSALMSNANLIVEREA